MTETTQNCHRVLAWIDVFVFKTVVLRVEPASLRVCGLTFVVQIISRLPTGHKWLRSIQTPIIKILCKSVKASHLRWLSHSWRDWGVDPEGHLQETSLSPFRRCSVCGSERSDLTSVISVFAVYGHMLHFLCCQPEPPLLFCSSGYYSVYLSCESWSSPTVTNRWPLDLESSQTHYQSDLSSARPPWFVPEGSRQCLLRLLSHPPASWHAMFAQVKWPLRPLIGCDTAVFDKWNDTKWSSVAANVFGSSKQVGFSYGVFTHQKAQSGFLSVLPGSISGHTSEHKSFRGNSEEQQGV